MANLGFQTVYHLLNSLESCVCERAFLPSEGDFKEHIRTDTPLFSYESQKAVKDFDVVAFSIPFEDDYVNIPKILRLAGIPVLAGERHALTPLVLAGGVAVSLNPEPLSELMDAFIIGEGEGACEAAASICSRLKVSGDSKKEALKALDEIEWVYVPYFHEFEYDGAALKSISPLEGAKKRVRARKNLDLSAFEVPRNFILAPDTEFKDTFLCEVERGCPRLCRFCAAGFLYLPPRWRDFRSVSKALEQGLEATGKAGLIGTAVSEYPEIKDAVRLAVQKGHEVTLSSLRLDRLDRELLSLLKESGYQTITLAPEAGSPRMRNAVNKGMTDADIFDTIGLIAEAGFLKLKLYFLVGLPGETDEDVQAIVELVRKIKEIMKKGSITLSVNPFIPKPFTPFQWHAFEDATVIDRRLKIIGKGLVSVKGVSIKALSSREAFIQAYISRADRRAGRFIDEASQKGWGYVMKRNKAFLEGSVYRERSKDEPLPWDIIDHGVRRAFLWNENRKGLEGKLTDACNVGSCFKCGVCLPVVSK